MVQVYVALPGRYNFSMHIATLTRIGNTLANWDRASIKILDLTYLKNINYDKLFKCNLHFTNVKKLAI